MKDALIMVVSVVFMASPVIALIVAGVLWEIDREKKRSEETDGEDGKE